MSKTILPLNTKPSALRTWINRNTREKMYLPSDLARSLQVSTKTVKRWIKTSKILPSVHIEQGKNKIALFTADDCIYYQNWYLQKSNGKQPKYREEVRTDDSI